MRGNLILRQKVSKDSIFEKKRFRQLVWEMGPSGVARITNLALRIRDFNGSRLGDSHAPLTEGNFLDFVVFTKLNYLPLTLEIGAKIDEKFIV